MSRKIFVVGDSRTGTTSLHGLFTNLGLKSIHYYIEEAGLHTPMHQFLDSNWERLRTFYLESGYEAYSDYPTRSFYKQIHELFPDAYFILSMRKSVEAWQGSMARYFADRGEQLNLGPLTRSYTDLNREIEEYFARQDDARFLKVVIDDGTDNGKMVKEFLEIQSPAALDQLNASKHERDGGISDESAREEIANLPRKFAKQSRVIQQALNKHYSNGSGDKAAYVGEQYFSEKPIGDALELGGGVGDYAFHVTKTLHPKHLTVYDPSEYSVEVGNLRAVEEKKDIAFERVDLDSVELLPNHYDLIYASNSLQHIENLENLFAQVNRALTPDGVFFCVDYMGPDYMQWTEEQLEIMNALLDCFPDRYTRNSLREGVVDRSVRRTPLETFQQVDSSEWCRASSIIPEMQKNLDVVELQPLGETLLYEMLRGRIHNFNDDDEQDAFVLRLLAMFEKLLIDREVLTSDFNFAVARKRSGALA